MTTQRALVPEDRRSYSPPPFVARAALACARHAFDPLRHGSAENAARAAWPNDRATLAVLERAASSPHSTASASALATSAVGDFLASLAPISAAASLFAAAPHVSLDEVATVSFPRRANALDASAVTWIDEAAPSRVPRLTVTTGAQLGPARKLLAIAAASRELVEASDGESILDLLLRESCAFSLDASVFSDAAATSAQPAGLLVGVAALTKSAAPDPATAMADDLVALAQAIAGVTSGLAYAANPKQAHSIRIRRGATWPDIQVWSSIAIPAGVVIALDTAAIVSAFGADPQITAGNQALAHFEDTTPLQIGTPGSPATVAAPAFSLFQADELALRLVLRVAWALRVPGAIAWLSGATW